MFRFFFKYFLRGLKIGHYNKGLNSVLLYRYYLELVLLAVASTSYRRHACSRHITASKVKLFCRHMNQFNAQTKEGADSFTVLQGRESFESILFQCLNCEIRYDKNLEIFLFWTTLPFVQDTCLIKDKMTLKNEIFDQKKQSQQHLCYMKVWKRGNNMSTSSSVKLDKFFWRPNKQHQKRTQFFI